MESAEHGALKELERRAGGAPLGPVLTVPLAGGPDREPGALAISRGERGHPFTRGERDTITRFARSVAIARDLARTRIDKERVALADERDRIARDLHDHVIQSLFAVGLTLQSVVGDPRTPVGGRIATQVEAIDATIRQIRQAIYRLGSPPGSGEYSLRARINMLVRQTLEGEDLDSRVEFSGPVDTLVDTELGDEVAAVVRESLSNAVRHARARSVDVSIAVRGANVAVTVADDGVGIGPATRRSGLENLAARAHQRAGEFVIADAEPHGTVVSWTVPWEAR
jgi:signal transduction histidine kinase